MHIIAVLLIYKIQDTRYLALSRPNRSPIKDVLYIFLICHHMAVETNFSALCFCSSEAHALPKTDVQAYELTVEPCSGASKLPIEVLLA